MYVYIYIFIYLFIHLFIYLYSFIYLSIYLFVHLFIYTYVYVVYSSPVGIPSTPSPKNLPHQSWMQGIETSDMQDQNSA